MLSVYRRHACIRINLRVRKKDQQSKEKISEIPLARNKRRVKKCVSSAVYGRLVYMAVFCFTKRRYSVAAHMIIKTLEKRKNSVVFTPSTFSNRLWNCLTPFHSLRALFVEVFLEFPKVDRMNHLPLTLNSFQWELFYDQSLSNAC